LRACEADATIGLQHKLEEIADEQAVLHALAGKRNGPGEKMSEEQTNFKVTDRRLFNSDGTPRDVPEEEKPAIKPDAAPAASPEPASSPEPAATADTVDSSAAVGASSQDQKQPAATDAEAELAGHDADAEVELPGAEDPASFASFMMSIASNAASALGMMEHPMTGKREVDLELGKHWIDILGMLQQKTRGNLLPQEQQILEGLLADLRMQYVALTNAAPKARTYSSRDITGG
jgi:hypothetical protein